MTYLLYFITGYVLPVATGLAAFLAGHYTGKWWRERKERNRT